MAASQSAPTSPVQAPPAHRPLRHLAAVLVTGALCLAAGHAVGSSGLPVGDLLSEEVQRISSTEDGMRYDTGTAGATKEDRLPVEAVLLRHSRLGGGKYELRLGHHPSMLYHGVEVPTGTGYDGGRLRITGADWGPERVTVHLSNGYTLGVGSDRFAGLR
ncbi:hypothetical protein GCM10027570_02940 [Streptomonospora sediminis]